MTRDIGLYLGVLLLSGCARPLGLSPGIFLLLFGGVIWGIWLVWKVPDMLVSLHENNKDDLERIKLKNEIRGTHAQIVFGLAVFISAFIAYKQYKDAQEKQLSDQLTSAFQMLGKDSATERTEAI